MSAFGEKKVNRARAMPAPRRLYDFRDAPNPRRTRGFLAEKALSIALEPIDLTKGEHRTEAFLKMNPLGQLPVLELADSTFISESIAICRYIESLHPAPALFGADARAQADIEMWNRRIELNILQAVGDVASHTDPLFADRVEQNADFAAARRRDAVKQWEWLDTVLADGRPFIAGVQFSVADLTAMAASWLGEMLKIAIPTELRHVIRWDTAMRTRPSWVA